ncbi:Na(+)/H(+) exchange regulatory cofactor NHE-RF3-like isoform X4 [Chiloscyllium plagiosum]|uniref:Na(+)/H(+) exchange regulatory cofactor NHE-RF3-like isoform X4 n=1 Tax=Chiloscyllium plagiosum TaxID=36176 RepID=UPI001CB7BDF8|nr:Na(+)/H(+) exchange regulatory cofactor NHE-RF3-like isoform X4 [Chiloscyllium plagiosum]
MKEQNGIEDTKALSPTIPVWQGLTWCTTDYETRANIPQGLSSGEYFHHWQTQDCNTVMVPSGHGSSVIRKFTFNPKEGIDNPALVICDDVELSISLKPRVCVLNKKDKEVFGFYLREENGKLGHIIRNVKPGSYAQYAGLFDADRVLEVNGEYVDNTEHFKVVEKIRLSGNKVTFLVVDGTTYEDAKMRNLNVAELIQSDIQAPCDKPRMCYVERGPNGFGFELCSSQGAKAPFTLSAHSKGPAEKGGVKSEDTLIEVNGVNVEDCTYLQVEKLMKQSGDSVTLLVADQRTHAYYQSKGIRIIPAMACFKHLPFKPRKLYLVKGSCGYGFLLKTERKLSGTYDDVEGQMESKQTTESRLPLEQAPPSLCHSTAQQATGPKARLCHLVKGSSGYGFQIYCITDEPGIYIQEVIPEDVGYKAGLRDGDMVIEVNGMNIEKVCYEDVLEKIKEKQHEVTLLVMNKKDYWYCKDNDLPISRESEDHETSKAESMEKRIVSSTSIRKKTNKTIKQDNNAHLVNKVSQLKDSNSFC